MLQSPRSRTPSYPPNETKAAISGIAMQVPLSDATAEAGAALQVSAQAGSAERGSLKVNATVSTHPPSLLPPPTTYHVSPNRAEAAPDRGCGMKPPSGFAFRHRHALTSNAYTSEFTQPEDVLPPKTYTKCAPAVFIYDVAQCPRRGDGYVHPLHLSSVQVLEVT